MFPGGVSDRVADQMHHTGLHRGLRPHQIQVAVARMDDVLPPGLRVNFLKIDVEGGELDVLRGAERTIVTWQPTVEFEWGAGAAAPYGVSKVDVHRFLSRCGLAVSDLQFLAMVDMRWAKKSSRHKWLHVRRAYSIALNVC